MKSRRQPLSEAFVYGSPERLPGFSFRWVQATPQLAMKKSDRQMGGGYERKHRN